MARRTPPEQGVDLQFLGLDSSAVALWRAMLRRPTATTEELLQAAGMDASGYSESVRMLLNTGCIWGDPSSPSGHSPVDPAVAIDSRACDIERQLSEQAAGIAAARRQISHLVDDYRQGRDLAATVPRCEVVTGQSVIQRRIYAEMQSCHYQQRSLDPNTEAEILAASVPTEVGSLDRGIRDRTIFATEMLADPVTLAALEAMHQHGAEVRTLPDVPARMLIMDDFLAVLPVDPTRSGEAALFIHEPSIVAVLVYLFDRLWEDANPVFSGGATDAPSNRQVRILELMAAGAKDEAIARALGVGARTIRRELSELKVHLAAASRAEMVGAAVRRGWL